MADDDTQLRCGCGLVMRNTHVDMQLVFATHSHRLIIISSSSSSPAAKPHFIIGRPPAVVADDVISNVASLAAR